MKNRRFWTSLVAVSVMVSCCGCHRGQGKETEETPKESTTASSTTEVTSVPTSDPSISVPTATLPPPTSVVDESEDTIVIYGYDKAFPQLLDTYMPSLDYDYVYVKPDDYSNKLLDALNGDERVPDLFLMDKDHLQTWALGGQTLDMEQLGISSAELQNQFPYTYEAASDASQSVHGLAYDLAPSCVFYNRPLAKSTLGTCEPSEVATLIADWSVILENARNVNMNTEGAVKLLGSDAEIQPIFWAMRQDPWVVDGQVNVGSELKQYIQIREAFFVENLTHGNAWGSGEWEYNLNNDKTVMFFGSLNTAEDLIGYVPGHEEKAEPSATEPGETTVVIPEETGWNVLPAPSATYDGGTWLMVPTSTDKRATAAQIIRTLTLDETVMTEMAVKGSFVNHIGIMEQCAQDPNFSSDFLNGQNPYAVLVPVAKEIKVSTDLETERCVETEIQALLDAYLNGDIKTYEELEVQFVVGLQELLGLV